jgi:hypothetical protein
LVAGAVGCDGRAVAPPPGEAKGAGRPGPPPGPVESGWTEAKVGAVLGALATFVHNRARKHGVPPEQVWALIRDEVLDPGGPR